MWLSGLSAGLRIKGSLVWFPVRAHAWVVGQVPSAGWGAQEATTHWCFSPSLSSSITLCLKINKIFERKKYFLSKLLSLSWESKFYFFMNHFLLCVVALLKVVSVSQGPDLMVERMWGKKELIRMSLYSSVKILSLYIHTEQTHMHIFTITWVCITVFHL